jgi:UPF0755 protein
MKKLFYTFFILIVIAASLGIWLVYGSATAFEEKSITVLVDDNHTSKEALVSLLKEKKVIASSFAFEQLGNQFKIWERVKSGKFKIAKDESLINIVRMFRNNKQAEINLVINKIRLPEDLARLISKNFSTDSATALSVLKNSTLLADHNADSNTFLFNVIPNTYSFYWSTPVEKIFDKISAESKKFWDENNRTQKAANLGLTHLQVYTIASIVEEETNKEEDKGNIASVYINRINKGMPLAADPTIKFALKDFTLKRILFGHLNVVSPYNTYRNKGLPPGPICTPSIKTLDAVLNAPRTDYIFFVAKADFSGYSHFSSNYAEHDQYAKLYQKALNEYLAKKQKTN